MMEAPVRFAPPALDHVPTEELLRSVRDEASLLALSTLPDQVPGKAVLLKDDPDTQAANYRMLANLVHTPLHLHAVLYAVSLNAASVLLTHMSSRPVVRAVLQCLCNCTAHMVDRDLDPAEMKIWGTGILACLPGVVQAAEKYAFCKVSLGSSYCF